MLEYDFNRRVKYLGVEIQNATQRTIDGVRNSSIVHIHDELAANRDDQKAAYRVLFSLVIRKYLTYLRLERIRTTSQVIALRSLFCPRPTLLRLVSVCDNSNLLMFHAWRPSSGARTAPGSASVALLAVIVMVGTLSFALGTRAVASDAPLRSTADCPVLSQRNQVGSRDNSRTTPAPNPTPKQDRSSTLARRTAIATWRFGSIAVAAAKTSLEGGGTALDALEAGEPSPRDLESNMMHCYGG